MSNHLRHETSPYLLQHAENPVDWYPWGEAAFQKARAEDKPVFLSIGYSTCHWCHVMAHESFEDAEIAEILNRSFVSVKVDREERPDIDSIYMTVCQAFTGSGGWPTSIFMTADQQPFFAGTYFPKKTRYGSAGLKDLLLAIHDKWKTDRAALLRPAQEVTAALRQSARASAATAADETLLQEALTLYRRSFDAEWGGFGSAPKFPAPHNLLFLMQQYRKRGDEDALRMAETTLKQMYLGGLFDHIGYGFCRYSTDRFFLVPHFEKMLYDNALLILAYCRAYEVSGKPFYRAVAEKTAAYILSEMTSPEGGFYSAEDADSDGEEGRFYVFTPDEIIQALGEPQGSAFNECFGITAAGNFEGKSIPNLLHGNASAPERFDPLLPKLREYRRSRASLHRDDKFLTVWNALTIAALCALYRRTRNAGYLEAAKRAQAFIEEKLCDGNRLFVSYRNGRRGENGFLDDYAAEAFALLALYEATLDHPYLTRAAQFADRAIAACFDGEQGGFYLSGAENETLLFRPKESYDGAIPSGNSLMAYNLVRLQALCPDDEREKTLKKLLAYLSGEAENYPAGHAMFLIALSDFLEPPMTITVAGADDTIHELPLFTPSECIVRILRDGSEEYPLQNGRTSFYVCRNHACLPPVDWEGLTALLRREDLE